MTLDLSTDSVLNLNKCERFILREEVMLAIVQLIGAFKPYHTKCLDRWLSALPALYTDQRRFKNVGGLTVVPETRTNHFPENKQYAAGTEDHLFR